MGFHDPATCPCNKCSAGRAREKDAVANAVANASRQAAGEAPGARQEIVQAEKLAEAIGRIYFDGNYVVATVPAAVRVDATHHHSGAIMTYTEFRVIYIPKEFLGA